MHYITTRNSNYRYSFEEALLMGYAPDGGLIMPEAIPIVTTNIRESWSELNFIEIADKVMELFISKDELPDEDRRVILEEAYSTFDSEEVVPIKTLNKGVKVAELYHGLTRSCKDVSLCVAGRLMQYFTKKHNKRSIALVGTAGDTGSASISAVAGLENVDIVVLYPLGRVTEEQELQLTTSTHKNVHVLAVDGTSDDLDVPIKECFLSEEFASQYNLSCLNSVNWARILLQTVPYIYCYFRARTSSKENVYFYVPTGAAGSLAAAVLVWEMGFPVCLVSCVNKNAIVHRTLQERVYQLAGCVYKTYASAMDIQVPYNIERILFMGSEYNTQLTNKLMRDMEMEEPVLIPEHVHNRIRKALIESCSIEDEEILQAMRACWNRNKYILCPHSATAMSFYCRTVNNDLLNPIVCMATASPSKFPEVVKKAGLPRVTDDYLEQLQGKEKRYYHINKRDDWLKVLKEKIQQIGERR